MKVLFILSLTRMERHLFFPNIKPIEVFVNTYAGIHENLCRFTPTPMQVFIESFPP